ncbi:MAG: hypothetical protein ACKPGK_10270, partial [Verrucomicrobiota bacterium]
RAFQFSRNCPPSRFFRHRFIAPVSGDEKAALSGDEKNQSKRFSASTCSAELAEPLFRTVQPLF